MIPGEYFLSSDNILCNEGRPSVTATIVNTGDRPVQIGSHFHFFEINKQLEFDRSKTFGMRLNIPAGTAVRFEPGEQKEVELVTFGGARRVVGFSNLVNGDTSAEANKSAAIEKASAQHFKNIAE